MEQKDTIDIFDIMEFSEDETNCLGEQYVDARYQNTPRNLIDLSDQKRSIAKSVVPRKAKAQQNKIITQLTEETREEQIQNSEGPAQELLKDQDGFFTCQIGYNDHHTDFICEENNHLFPSLTKNTKIDKEKVEDYFTKEDNKEFYCNKANEMAQWKGSPLKKFEMREIPIVQTMQELHHSVEDEESKPELKESARKRGRPSKLSQPDLPIVQSLKKIKSDEPLILQSSRVSVRLQAKKK
jgi:hypothetical protein